MLSSANFAYSDTPTAIGISQVTDNFVDEDASGSSPKKPEQPLDSHRRFTDHVTHTFRSMLPTAARSTAIATVTAPLSLALAESGTSGISSLALPLTLATAATGLGLAALGWRHRARFFGERVPSPVHPETSQEERDLAELLTKPFFQVLGPNERKMCQDCVRALRHSIQIQEQGRAKNPNWPIPENFFEVANGLIDDIFNGIILFHYVDDDNKRNEIAAVGASASYRFEKGQHHVTLFSHIDRDQTYTYLHELIHYAQQKLGRERSAVFVTPAPDDPNPHETDAYFTSTWLEVADIGIEKAQETIVKLRTNTRRLMSLSSTARDEFLEATKNPPPDRSLEMIAFQQTFISMQATLDSLILEETDYPLSQTFSAIVELLKAGDFSEADLQRAYQGIARTVARNYLIMRFIRAFDIINGLMSKAQQELENLGFNKPGKSKDRVRYLKLGFTQAAEGIKTKNGGLTAITGNFVGYWICQACITALKSKSRQEAMALLERELFPKLRAEINKF